MQDWLMLSRTAEHAVRAAVLLGLNHGQRAISADEIASLLGAPRNYLSKTLNVLVRHGLVASARGPGGGFTLAVPPGEITVADIVDVFAEARPTRVRCLLGDRACDAHHPCSAHQRWSAITQQAQEPLRNTTIAHLCGDGSPVDIGGRP
jgi:Rrf2 family protein